LDLSSTNSPVLKKIEEIEDTSENKLTKALDSNIIADLKEIIDSVSVNLSLNKASNGGNLNEDSSEDEDLNNDKLNLSSSNNNNNNNNLSNNNLINLNNLKICIDDIEELTDKNNKGWFVFVIHVWNMRVPQHFNDDGECCTSWCVKR
jgi:hypothetical protein